MIPTSPISTSSNQALVAHAAKLHSTSRFRHVNIIDYNTHSVGTTVEGDVLTPKISARGLSKESKQQLMHTSSMKDSSSISVQHTKTSSNVSGA